jgi:hypothetical protein
VKDEDNRGIQTCPVFRPEGYTDATRRKRIPVLSKDKLGRKIKTHVKPLIPGPFSCCGKNGRKGTGGFDVMEVLQGAGTREMGEGSQESWKNLKQWFL